MREDKQSWGFVIQASSDKSEMVVRESPEPQKPGEEHLRCSLQLLPLGVRSRSDDRSSDPLSPLGICLPPVCISLRSQGKSNGNQVFPTTP